MTFKKYGNTVNTVFSKPYRIFGFSKGGFRITVFTVFTVSLSKIENTTKH